MNVLGPSSGRVYSLQFRLCFVQIRSPLGRTGRPRFLKTRRERGRALSPQSLWPPTGKQRSEQVNEPTALAAFRSFVSILPTRAHPAPAGRAPKAQVSRVARGFGPSACCQRPICLLPGASSEAARAWARGCVRTGCASSPFSVVLLSGRGLSWCPEGSRC